MTSPSTPVESPKRQNKSPANCDLLPGGCAPSPGGMNGVGGFAASKKGHAKTISTYNIPKPDTKPSRSHSRTASGTHYDAAEDQQADFLEVSSESYHGPVTTINSTVGKFFEVVGTPVWLCQHTVSFFSTEPKRKEVSLKSLKRVLLKELVDEKLSKSGMPRPVHHGAETIYSMKPLHDELTATPSEKLYGIDYRDPKQPGKLTRYEAKIRRLPDVKFENVRDCTKGSKCGGGDDCPVRECLNALNALLQSVLRAKAGSEGWVPVNDTLYMPMEPEELKGSKEAKEPMESRTAIDDDLMGLRRAVNFSINLLGENCRSVARAEKVPHKLVLSIGVQPMPFIKAGNLGTIYRRYLEEIPANTRETKERRQSALDAFVKRLNVHLIYSPSGKPKREDSPGKLVRISDPEDIVSGRAHRIASFGLSADKQMFNYRPKKTEISVEQYYKTEREYILNTPRQPVANIGSIARPIWVPLELLWVQEQPCFKNPPIRDPIKFNSVLKERGMMVRGFDINLMRSEDEVVKLLSRNELKELFSIHFKPEAEAFQGRLLTNGSDEELAQEPGIARPGKIRAPHFEKSPRKVIFVAITCGSEKDSHEKDLFKNNCTSLFKTLKKEGNMSSKSEQQFEYCSSKEVQDNIKDRKELLNDIHCRDSLVFIGLQGTDQERKEIHAMIRFWSDTVSGQATVFFDTSKFNKVMLYWGDPDDNKKEKRTAVGYARSLLTKAVHRFEGHTKPSLTLKDLAKPGRLLEKTMVIGASLVPGEIDSIRNLPSISTVATSIDKTFVQYRGFMKPQEAGGKTILHLGDMVKEALNAYFEKNENLPESILYFRNCVGEDDFDIIKSAETLRIADAFNEVLDKWFPEPKPGQRTEEKNLRTVFPNDAPRICIVALSKGSSTRFFPDGSSVRGGIAKNLKGGVVVDTNEFQKTSAKAREFDFHLQSYSNLCNSADKLGFASNTHYFVLKNEPHWKREDIEQVTNRLCYVNAVEAATSYVTPALYSRKICERGREYLRSVISDNSNEYTGLTPEQAVEEFKKVKLVLPDKPMFWL